MRKSERAGIVSALVALWAVTAGLQMAPVAGASVDVAGPERYEPRNAAGGLTCRGERATLVVDSEPEQNGGAERDVIVVVGAGLEVFASGGDDLICVYGAPAGRYDGHGSTIYGGPGTTL